MNKFLILSVLMGVMLATMVVAQQVTDQGANGVVPDQFNVLISPPSVEFGSIEYGTNIEDAGSQVTVNATGSDTSSGNLHVAVSIEDDSNLDLGGFFTTLLMLKESTDTEYAIAHGFSFDVPEMSSVLIDTKLSGNTAQFGAGSKSATIVYTISGLAPSG